MKAIILPSDDAIIIRPFEKIKHKFLYVDILALNLYIYNNEYLATHDIIILKAHELNMYDIDKIVKYLDSYLVNKFNNDIINLNDLYIEIKRIKEKAKIFNGEYIRVAIDEKEYSAKTIVLNINESAKYISVEVVIYTMDNQKFEHNIKY